ncbi:MAG: YIP1 family protein [Chloroflexi bacterium]|jgi:hypothetical protein|nr:YIP1 family protein [Chloroflexota bacterium]
MSNSRLLVPRMIRAARLDSYFYEEVEADRSANWQALQVVLISGLASAIGYGIATVWMDDPPELWKIFVSLMISTIAGWFAWSFFTWIIGTTLFKTPQTSSNYGELLRTIGFAHAPLVLAVFLFVPYVGGIIYFMAGIWSLIAGVVAVRQALDFSTARAIGTCIIGWILYQLLFVFVIGTF